MTFWSQPLEEYFPMETPPGARSTVERWRKMASQWCSTGVDRNYRFGVFFYNSADQTFQLGQGAVFVNGFYAEQRATVVLACPGDNGIVVARYQPELQEVRLVWRPGAGPGDVIRDPIGWYEAPIGHISGGAFVADLRRFVPLPWLPPPVTEMPPWVPRGFIGHLVGPAVQFPGPPNTGGAGEVLRATVGNYPRFVPGRHYRVFMATRCEAYGGTGIVRFSTHDGAGVRTSHVVATNPQTLDGTVRTISVVVRNWAAGAVAILSSEGGAPFPFIHWEVNSTRIEVEDIGQ